MKHNINVDIRY